MQNFVLTMANIQRAKPCTLISQINRISRPHEYAFRAQRFIRNNINSGIVLMILQLQCARHNNELSFAAFC